MRALFILFFFSVGGLVFAQSSATATFVDELGWISYLRGNMPLVISAPHGGTINLKEVPDRSCEGAVTVTDSYTSELAFDIAAHLQKYYKQSPHLIICNVSRKDVDQNRPMDEGTCGQASMEGPWKLFHSQIDEALKEAVEKFGFCVFIDLHGHGHPEQRLEIGYLLDKEELTIIVQQKNNELGDHSLVNLTNLLGKQIPLSRLIFGSESFGTMMANEGFPAVPSAQDPYPLEGQKFFNGGYNTKRYTSKKYPAVIGWQIESNMRGVRDSSGRPVFAAAFSKVITRYIDWIASSIQQARVSGPVAQ